MHFEIWLVFCKNADIGPIIESKGMRAIFQKKRKKGQKMLKSGKKKKRQNVQIWKYLKKGRWLRAIIERNKLLEKVLK